MTDKAATHRLVLRRAAKAARAAAVGTIAAGGAMIALAIVAPWFGLGRDEHSVFFRAFGVTRFDLAADGAVVLIVGLLLAAPMFSRSPLVVTCNTIVPLLLVELLARAIDGQPIFSLRNWLAERNSMFATTTVNDYDPVLGWVLRPHVRLNPDDPARAITTGAHGVRLSRPDAGEPPLGAVLAVGDSFTFGTDVGDRDAWPAYLERMIARPTVNAGVPGYGTDQIVLRAESLLPALKPSTLIVSFFQADLERAAMRVFIGANKSYFTVEDGALVLHNVPVPRYSGRLSETPLWLVPLSHLYFIQFATDRLGWADWWQYSMRSAVGAGNDPVAVSCALLRRLKDATAAGGTRLLLLLQYAGARSTPKPPKVAAVAVCAKDNAIDTLDLWEDLAGLRDRAFDQYAKLWLGPADKPFGHMSPQGNRFVAERLAAVLSAGALARPRGTDR